MTSFTHEIQRNKIKSILLMLAFGALSFAIIYMFMLYFGAGPYALVIGAGIVVAYAAFTYFTGDRIVLAVSRAKPADRKQYPKLYEIIGRLSSENGIQMPKVYLINDQSPNAFATGKSRKASSVAVTTGLLAIMDDDELKGVLAHEMSHVAHNDIQFMMLAVVFAGAIGLVSAFMRNILFFGGIGNNRNGGMLLLVGLVAGIIAPFIALLMRLAISRRREYMADANGARIIENPKSLANALRKIQQYEQNPKVPPVRHANEITSSLYFSNPFKKSSALRIFSTHPPIEERIAKLEQMA
ncbi:MAG: M48 family metallopeptidase [Candidatus Marsarchaeota archaeon]|nr:M48 family metallopeptidase [Candidatus Marsarchaeota archaeon]